jgi:hypothetical protein
MSSLAQFLEPTYQNLFTGKYPHNNVCQQLAIKLFNPCKEILQTAWIYDMATWKYGNCSKSSFILCQGRGGTVQYSTTALPQKGLNNVSSLQMSLQAA